MKCKDELSDLAEKFIEQLNLSTLSGETILSYRSCANNIVRFARDQGKHSYYDSLSEEYTNYINLRLASGKIKDSKGVFYTRVLRMFVSFAETGEIDYSRKPIEQRLYILSNEGEKLAQNILEYSDIQECKRKDYIATIRHILYYAKENEYEYYGLDDTILLDFLSNEAKITNSGDMSRAIRAVRCTATYFQNHNIGNIQYSYKNLKINRKGRKLLPAFEPSEVKAMIDCLDTKDLTDMRNRAMILLGYTTGLRCIDVIKLKKKEINWRKQCINIIQSKTGVPLAIEIPPITINALADYILKMQDCHKDIYENTEYVFLTGKSQYKEISRSLNCMIRSVEIRANVKHIPNRGFHGLRRSFAVSLSSAEVPLETISKMLGHISPRSDRAYLSFNRKQTEFVALDFSDVPVNSQIYNDIFNVLNKREE